MIQPSRPSRERNADSRQPGDLHGTTQVTLLKRRLLTWSPMHDAGNEELRRRIVADWLMVERTSSGRSRRTCVIAPMMATAVTGSNERRRRHRDAGDGLQPEGTARFYRRQPRAEETDGGGRRDCGGR